MTPDRFVCSDDLGARHNRVVTAALRAAYAWSHRAQHPMAMREIARMTGVVMEAHGPGSGPRSPIQLVANLHEPLSGMLSFAPEIDRLLREVVLLDGEDHLTDTAYDVASEYAQRLSAVFESADWLPSWTRMRARETQDQAFRDLVESGDQDAYVRARRFLIEHPAGLWNRIQDLRAKTGARLAASYRPLVPEQRYQDETGEWWWWSCPVCRWPMAISGVIVRCLYRPHQARYQITRHRGARTPRLLHVLDRGPKVPAARPAEAAVAVEAAVWRSIVVPGATEIRIADEVNRRGGRALLWQNWDLYDLDIMVGGRSMRFDVKEYRSVHRLIEDLREKPPAAPVLLPKTHERQHEQLSSAFPSLVVKTETQLWRTINQLLRSRS